MADTLDDVVTELVTLNGRVELVGEHLVGIEANTQAAVGVARDTAAIRVGLSSLADAVRGLTQQVADVLAREERVRLETRLRTVEERLGIPQK